MFDSVLKKWNNFDYDSFKSGIRKHDINRILRKDKITELDLLALISYSGNEFIEEAATISAKITQRNFGRTVQLYTPLYLSNYCENSCLYCGFNRSNNINRSKLTLNEVHTEAKKIKESGIQHILILTGGDREKTSIKYIISCIEILKEYFTSISIEIYALTQSEYTKLINLGINNVTIYQETYNETLYRKLHKTGEKANYEYRLHAPERAAMAGINSVNLGVLLGLSSPEIDFFKTCLHADYIRKKYPATEIAISLPRIRSAAGGYQPKYSISDMQLVKFIIGFRIYLPLAEISISTRESSTLRDNLLRIGTTKMSAESYTSVGGRIKKENRVNQFDICDDRTVYQLDQDLRKNGYQPIYKNWEIL